MRLRKRQEHTSLLPLARRVAAAGTLSLGLTLLSWLPSPLPGRTLPAGIPATEVRAVSIPASALLSKAPSRSLVAEAHGVRAPRAVTLRPIGMCAPIRFTAVALTWNQQGGGATQARIQGGLDLRHWGAALDTETIEDGPDGGTRESLGGRTGTDLAWTGTAECARIQLTLSGHSQLSYVRALFINTEGTARGPARQAAPSARSGIFGTTAAEAMTSRPAIVTRAQWGANERYRNCGPYYSPRVKMAFVHHTANANNYTRSQSAGIIRAIYWYHTKGLGWCDIAYNFLVDKYGRIFEGRYGGMTLPVLPGATKGFNTGSTAVSAIGNFQTAKPTAAMIAAIERVLAWRLDWAHVDPSSTVWMYSRGSTGNKYPPGTWVRFRTIAGHRNAGYTSCPGNYLYARLPDIRSAVYRMGLPKIFNAKQSRSSFITGQGQVTWRAAGSATMNWKLQVFDETDQVVRSWSRSGSTFSVTWDGLTRLGEPAPPGVYRIILQAWNGTGRARPAEFELTIEPVPPCPSATPSGSPSPTPSGSPSSSPSPCPSPTPSPSS